MEGVCRYFGACGATLKPWEAYTLLKTDREALESEVDGFLRAGGAPTGRLDPAMAEKLETMRRRLEPLFENLQEFLDRCGVPLDAVQKDLALLFLMGSAAAREAVARWVDDPKGQAEEAALRIRALAVVAEDYRKALRESHASAPPPPEPAVPEETAGPARAPAPAKGGVNLKVVENVRLVRRARQVLQDQAPVEPWEVMTLLVSDRETVAQQVKELIRLKKEGRPGELAGEVYRFRERIDAVRSQHGAFLRDLRAYLARIFGKWEGDAEDLALAFLASTQKGRHRGRQWLDDPDLCREEAAGTAEGLVERARLYLTVVERTTRRATVSGP